MWCGPTVKLFFNFFKEIPLVFLFSLQRDIRDLKEEQSILFFLCFSNHEKKKKITSLKDSFKALFDLPE